MDSSDFKLTAAQIAGLEFLALHGGCVLTSEVDDRQSRDVFGNIVPGHSTFRALEKLGLCFYTVEEPLKDPSSPFDGFVFTNEIYLTEAGKDAIKTRKL